MTGWDQVFQFDLRLCGLMFAVNRNPMRRCGAATRCKAVDSWRHGIAMLEIESLVELLRTCDRLRVKVHGNTFLYTFLAPCRWSWFWISRGYESCDTCVSCLSVWFAAQRESHDANSYKDYFICVFFIHLWCINKKYFDTCRIVM